MATPRIGPFYFANGGNELDKARQRKLDARKRRQESLANTKPIVDDAGKKGPDEPKRKKTEEIVVEKNPNQSMRNFRAAVKEQYGSNTRQTGRKETK